MKRFEELTREELAVLTDEQRQYYIDFACAERGIPFLPPKPADPKTKKPVRDSVLYSLNLGYFLNAIDAQDVLDYVKKKGYKLADTRYLSGPSYEIKYEPRRIENCEISRTEAYSPAVAEQYKSVIEEAEKSKKAYEDELAEYNNVRESREKIESEIDEKISTAYSFLEKRQYYVGVFNRYLEMANNDRETAVRFFTEAYGSRVPQEIMDELTE